MNYFLYRVRRWAQLLVRWLTIENPVARALRSPFVSTVTPTLAGSYFTLYKLFGEDWAIFYSHPVVHNIVTMALITVTLMVSLLTAITSIYLKRHEERFLDRLKSLHIAYQQIVDAKLARFRTTAADAQNASTVFETITRPKEQIEVNVRALQSFLVQSYDLADPDQARITIFAQHPSIQNNQWTFLYDNQPNMQENTGRIDENFFEKHDVMRRCLENGEPLFIVDKRASAARGQYTISARDDRLGNGSLYCYPISNVTGSMRARFVICITTYGGHRLGEAFSGDSEKLTAATLCGVCRRIELELTLYCLSLWRDSANAARGS